MSTTSVAAEDWAALYARMPAKLLDDEARYLERRLRRCEEARRAIIEARLDAIEGRLAGLEREASYAPEQPDDRELLRQAIEDERVVKFSYHGRDAVTLRTLSPYVLRESQSGDELLMGYDHDRDALRQFQLDRIAGIHPVDEDFVAAP
jgi:predicted DNA-binding transcriptional regulator YafY